MSMETCADSQFLTVSAGSLRYDVRIFTKRSGIMGLFDQVVGSLAGAGEGKGALLDVVMQLVNKYPGGVAGLVQAFQQGGLGEIANSWVSTGANLPLSGEQLQGVLGGDLLGQLAARLGSTPEQASSGVAQLLPQIVDQLTPNGQLPQGGELLSQGLDLLKKGGLFG